MSLFLLFYFAGPASAQAPSTPATGSPAPSSNAALRALDLPLTAQRTRRAGVPEVEVKKALDGMKGAGHSAADADDTLAAAVSAAEEHGPVDNFGAFVQEQLAAGKRGKDLAAAIRAEHETRGKKHAGGAEGGAEKEKDETEKDKTEMDKGHEGAEHGRGEGGRPDAGGGRRGPEGGKERGGAGKPDKEKGGK